MTLTTRLADELLPTTTQSAANPAARDIAVVRSAKHNIVVNAVERFDGVKPKSGLAGSLRIDDYIAQLEQDAEWSAELAQARRALGSQKDLVTGLASLRLARGLTQRALAQLVGTSQPLIARLEKGQGNPELNTLRRLAKELGVTTQEVLTAFEQQEVR